MVAEASGRSFPVKRIILIGVAASLVLGLVLSWWVLNVLAMGRLRRAQEVADQSDPDWRLTDLMARRETIPDEENSALQVLEVLKFMPATWPPIPKLVPSTEPGHPPKAGQDILTRISQVPLNRRINVDLLVELRDELDAREPAVKMARQLAGMNRGRYPLTIQFDVWSTLIPHAENVIKVAKLMHADAIRRAHDGDMDGALESCRAMIQSGRSLGDEPFQVTQMVRKAIVGQGLVTLEHVLALGTASDEALAKVEALLVDEAGYPILQIAIQSERAALDEMIQKVASGKLGLKSLGLDSDWQSPASAVYYHYNQAVVLEQMNQAMEIARLPEADQLDAWVVWRNDLGQGGSLFTQSTKVLARMLLPTTLSMGQVYLRSQAKLDMATALVASERFRIAAGRMPTNLDFLMSCPELAGVQDPYVGRGFRSKMDDTGFVVYSVGFDRTDQGGRFHPRGLDQFGFDEGVKLYSPEDRALPPEQELPEDVFQHSGL